MGTNRQVNPIWSIHHLDSDKRVYIRPAIPLTVALMTGIVVGRYLPGPYLWAVAGAAAAVVFIVFRLWRKKPASMAPLILFAVLGYLSILPWTAPQFPDNHITRFADNTPWLITGQLTEAPVARPHALRFVIETRSLKTANHNSGNLYKTCGKLRVTLAGFSGPLNIGDTIRLRGKIRLIRSFKNPGGFQYDRYMGYQKIWASTYVTAAKVTSHTPATNGHWKGLTSLRSRVAALIDAQIQNPDVQGVLKALLLGERQAISAQLREAFSRTGIGHILAISGLHIGIVATVVFFLAGRLFGFVNLLIWRAWVKNAAALAALVAAVAYGALAGWSPSTQRAVIMVAVFLATFWVKREQESFNTLAWAALIILIIHPPTLFTISFQLSFGAVLAIIYGLGVSARRDPFKKSTEPPSLLKRLGSKALTLMMISVWANLGTLPFLMYYFNQVSTSGVFANVLIVPLMGFVVVPLGLLAILMVLLQATAPAAFIIKICGLILHPTLEAVTALATLPFVALKTFTPGIIEISAYFVLGGALFALLPQPRLSDSGVAEAGRKWRWTHLALATAAMVLAVDGSYWIHQRYFSKNLRATILDVGHGNAAVLEMPRGRVFLVDGGGFSDNAVFDVGQRIVAPYLWRRKIMTVETLILSHPNSDHFNGLDYIAENFNVKNLWSNNEKAPSASYAALMATAKDKLINLPAYEKLYGQHTINDVILEILYPPPGFNEQNPRPAWRNANNNSLVVKISHGDLSLLFPGDIMKRAEKELVRLAGSDLKSNVLVAPHHGSKNSNSDLFLAQVRPEAVIISSRFSTSGRYPPKVVLNRYKGLNCRIWRTDTHGAIVLTSDGDQLLINSNNVQTRTAVR
jgi:competence protein ComEC